MDIKKFERHFVVPRDRIKSNSSQVGQAVYNLLKKPQEGLTVEEIIDQAQHDFVKKMEEVVNDNVEKYDPPFYIIVLSKKEHWSELVLRNWFVARQTKPSAAWLRQEYPNHLLTLYSYDKRPDKLDVLWSLPTRQDSDTVLKNRHLYDPALVKYITDFDKGFLDRACEGN